MLEAFTKDEVDLISAIQDAIAAAHEDGAEKIAMDLAVILNDVRIAAAKRSFVGKPKFPHVVN